MNEFNDEDPKPTTSPHFGDLVRNAVDFLSRSVHELIKGDLKYSSIHFYQAIELFVKARLLAEHWTLIVIDPSKVTRAQFDKGDFLSVSLPQAIQRLRAVANEDIANSEKAFEPVRKRRNRVIHFHATEYSDLIAAKLMLPNGTVPAEMSEIVAEQCHAWFELHTLLSTRWRVHFSDFESQLFLLNKRMLELRPYLQARFERLSNSIQKLKGSITNCDACGFAATHSDQVFPGMTQSQCLVCQQSERVLKFKCPEDGCSGEVVVHEYLGGSCTKCDCALSVEALVEHFEEPQRPGSIDDRSRAYCSECESQEVYNGTVVLLEPADKFVCFNCLEDFDCTFACEWCGESITADSEGTFLSGCMNCGGRLGHDSDD